MVHAVAPRRLVRCTPMLPGNGQFLMTYSLMGNRPLCRKKDVVVPSICLVLLDGLSFVRLCMSCRLIFGVTSESICTYKCMISSPASFHP